MRVSKLFAIAAMATTLSAQAQLIDKGVVGPGDIGPMDNSQAILVGFHPADSVGFIDSFIFNVVNPGVAVGVIDASLLGPNFLASDLATIGGVFFFDAAANVLVQDFDGSDGFSVTTPLFAAGTYGFGVAGLGGAGAGAYSGVMLSINPAIPEPETYALMLGGLVLLAGAVRRRRQSV
jgi:PEP-CTERM motif